MIKAEAVLATSVLELICFLDATVNLSYKNQMKILSAALILLSSFSSISCYADGPKIWFENEGGLSRDQLTNGKIKIRHSFFGNYDIKELVKDNPTSLALVEKQSTYNTYAHLSYWLGVIPSSAFLGYGLGDSNAAISVISVVTLIGTGLLTFHYVSESRHYMYEAMNHYNGRRTSPAIRNDEVSKTPFSPRLGATSFDVSFSF